jgi:hypothetical protein
VLTPIDPDADAGVGSCAFEIGPPPSPYLERRAIDVFLGQDLVPHDPSRMNGWDYLAADDSSFELFGPACDLFTANADGGIDGGMDGGTGGELRVLFLCLVDRGEGRASVRMALRRPAKRLRPLRT